MASLALSVQVKIECYSVTLDLSWTADRLQDSVRAAADAQLQSAQTSKKLPGKTTLQGCLREIITI